MITNLNKLPKRKITIDELLDVDGITDLIDDIYQKRLEIDQFVFIYTDKDSSVKAYYQGNRERILYALEKTKFDILSESTNDED
jgi:hypothetical protein